MTAIFSILCLIFTLTPAFSASANEEATTASSFNGTMMQYFEWYLPSDGSHWNFMKEQADELADAGITALWIPPAYKAAGGTEDVGYGAYDLYDLGEFYQQGAVRTKYGTKSQLQDAISSLHNEGVQVYGDVVINHKGGADATENVQAIQVNWNNRLEDISGQQSIEAWTKFDFPGRNNKYSSFKWNWTHFDGVDWNQATKTKALYRLVGDYKYWDLNVGSENGNYDYLLYADVDFDNPYVQQEMKDWGTWFVNELGLDGFRLDAIKHIDSQYMKSFLGSTRSNTNKELFTVGEYWLNDLGALKGYLNQVDYSMSLFDVPLHYNFYEISNGNGNYDMRNILEGTLVQSNPEHAVTLVDNHDSQPGQSLESWVLDWFKPSAYAFILTREAGYPTLFYGDYYGIDPTNADGKKWGGMKSEIDPILKARKEFAYGTQHDYIDDQNIIGWTREGDSSHDKSGLAAIITDNAGGSKKMYVGSQHSGETWVDMTGNQQTEVTIDGSGHGLFTVGGGSVSIYVNKAALNGGGSGGGGGGGDDTVTVYYKEGFSNPYIHYNANGTWTTPPGAKMDDSGIDGYYKYTVNINSGTELTAAFNDGQGNWDSNNDNNYVFPAGTWTLDDGTITAGAPSGGGGGDDTVTVYYKEGFSNPYIHYNANGTWTTPPGAKMDDSGIDGYYKYTVNINSGTELTAVFNDGQGNWDNNNDDNYVFSAGTWTLDDGTITAGAPSGGGGGGGDTDEDTLKIVVDAPSNTSQVYLASELNNWNAGDEAYKLTQNGNGEFEITLNLEEGTSFNYKFTQGSWESVEVNQDGSDTNNRSYTTKGGSEVVSVTVTNWKN